ncbi:hypothetical protein M422DRAFT_782890 [Sphaerobolus stellatus SS14]|uniref:Cytochrome P450 n=1 Tax=Sphaerobolus stellatus (strain SS14) TaxID=990650 RepID=A0A0C9UHX1_SPHS4|nr:hypothetical protein M422DRAFT_782890 [Sphaerobolus stellatus SS14]
MPSLLLLAGPVLLTLWAIHCMIRRSKRHSIDYLPGPSRKTYFFRPTEFGEADLNFTKEYGAAIRTTTTFGRDVLFTSDPKAIQYIMNTSGYNFPKPADRRVTLEMATGRGPVWAEGTAREAVTKTRRDFLANGKPQVVNVLTKLHRTTLDAIGEAAFGYNFHAIDQKEESVLAKAYDNLLPKSSMHRPDFSLIFETFLGFLPSWLVKLGITVPVGRFKLLSNYMRVAEKVAQEIIDKQTDLYLKGKEGSKDVMSLLVRANLSEDPRTKLSSKEIIPQMTTLFLAGHDTAATTTAWFLYELAKYPECQTRIREEIAAVKAVVAERGDTEPTIADLDGMEYTLAETLSFHGIVANLSREATRDDVIPLQFPQKTRYNDTVTSIPVRKGQYTILSLFAYNRLTQVWGPDADKWKPERFLSGSLKESQKVNVGVIVNVMSFSSGLRSCVGWRFAVLEMQAILMEFIEKFEFTLAPNVEIYPAFAGLMSPMVRGSNELAAEMPLIVKPL